MNERRVRWILGLVLIVQLVLISAQVRRTAVRGTYLEAALLRLAGPVARIVTATSNGLTAVGHALSTRNRLLQENRELRERLEGFRQQRVRSFGLEQEVRRLSRAVEYSRRAEIPLRVADVVWIDHASFFQTLVLRVDEGQLQTNHPVVAAEGLVGRVVVTAGPYAKVQLITDRAASVGAMIERTRRQGVARGAGSGLLDLDFVPLQEEVEIGDRVITAGIDGIYPRGLPVGTVVAVEPGSELFHEIRLRPAVDFGLLDQVYVLESELVPEQTKDLSPDAQP